MPELETLSLGPNEAVSGKPFTSIKLIAVDLTVLGGMIDDLVGALAEVEAGTRTILSHDRLAWTSNGLARRLLICDEKRLRVHPEACVVGFFGERRTELDIGPLEEANSAIVAQFRNYPGILSYSSVELPNGYWANMVLHDDPVDREYWSRGALHAQAARTLSPVHYRTVRIHNARLTARIEEHPEIRVLKTKYWDYSETGPWTAERELVVSDPNAAH
ncbi:MAG: hypothetical protein WBM90_14365 [Acidimicrobiia bacterium]